MKLLLSITMTLMLLLIATMAWAQDAPPVQAAYNSGKESR